MLIDLENVVVSAARRMSKQLVESGYILGTTSEAVAFLAHYIISELGEDKLWMLYLNRVPGLAVKENEKKCPDLVLLNKSEAVFVKVRVIPRGLKARHARERLWGRKGSGGVRIYSLPYHAEVFRKMARMVNQQVKALFIIFDEKNYLTKEGLKELEEAVKKAYPYSRVIHFNLRKIRELKQRGLIAPHMLSNRERQLHVGGE